MSSDRSRTALTSRLPASWQVVLGGVVAQVAVAAAVLGRAVASGDPLGALAGWYLLGLVLLAALVAAVSAALLRARRRQRTAAVVAALVGACVLVVTEFAAVTLVLPLCLFLAAALGWREDQQDAARAG